MLVSRIGAVSAGRLGAAFMPNDASLVVAGMSPTDAARQLGLGRATVYREMASVGVRRSG